MKAVLLIGGEGTRLRPLTCNMAKCMVPVLNRPFLEHVIEYLRRYGVTEIVLTVSYLPESIRSHFDEGRAVGVKLTYAIEKNPLGTAGAVKNAGPFDDTFLVLNGDVFTAIDLSEMLARHRGMKAQATIALTPVDNPTVYGVVECGRDGRVKRFLEKPRLADITTNLINAGVYLLEPSVLEHVEANTRAMFEYDLFPLLLKRGDMLLGHASKGYWIDMGTPQKYAQLNRDLLTDPKLSVGSRPKSGVLTGPGSQIAATATIKGPTIIGDGCVIGPDSVVEQCVLWDRVVVGRGVTMRNSILASDCSIGDGVVLKDAVLGSSVEVPRGAQVEPGARIWPDTCLEPNHPSSE